jgi:hypothetical protein
LHILLRDQRQPITRESRRESYKILFK